MDADQSEKGEEEGQSVMRALGRAIVSAASLESALKLQLGAFTDEATAANSDVAHSPAMGGYQAQRDRLNRLTAGQLLGELRGRGFPPELLERVDDAIKRRNQLVHRILQDDEIVRAVSEGNGLDQVIARIEQLVRDCSELAIELYTITIRIFEEVTGKSAVELADILTQANPSMIDDPHDRAWLEALQADGDISF
ncbi:MAG: hypothetical protein ACLPUT_06310 [Solirubrobacteraceae bacterium]